MTGALDGIVVVAVEQAVAAPFATSRLADAGARVIKVERDTGDFARHYDDVAGDQSAFFVWLNRGKESLVLNIKDKADADLLKRILLHADVLVHNLAPGAMDRAGLGSDALRAANPRLITCEISGYGTDGPYKDMKAYDMLVQAETGLASITGTADAPGRVGVSICDISSGMYAHAAILEALFERDRTGTGTGKGKAIHISMFDSLADWMTVPLMFEELGDGAPQRTGMQHAFITPYGAFPTADGEIVLAIQNEREWQSFCEIVLLTPDMAGDPRFDSNQRRVEHKDDLTAEIEKIFIVLPRRDVVARLAAARIAYGSINSVAELSQHPQLRRASVETPSGTVSIVAPPGSNRDNLGAVPALGEHSQAIRDEFE